VEGSGDTVKECPAFVVETRTDWPLYVPPASQSLPLPQLRDVVGENPLGIEYSVQITPSSVLA
jgi:hypothetical protein